MPEDEEIEVVINTCIGGFGLSKEAILELYECGAKAIEVFDIEDYIKDYEDILDNETSREEIINYLHSVAVKDDKVIVEKYSFVYERGLPEDQKEYLRADKDLVAVVKKLGKKANNINSSLKIVKIPKGIKWYIAEDETGSESVEEEHRSWK